MVYKTKNTDLFGYQIQLLDFGFARKFEASVDDKEIMGSPHYVAPETLKQSYSYGGDVWSIGIMLYYAIALQYPFEADSDEKLFQAIKEDQLVFKPESAWEDIPIDLKSLIEQMLEKDPKKRIHIEQIPVHRAFKEIHKIEDSVNLTSEEQERLTRYYKLSPLQRKFLKYSTKFIPPKEKVVYCEKYTLLDKDNNGHLEFSPKAGTKDDTGSNR